MQLARSVIRTCTVCRRLTGKKFKYPSVPALPSYRVRRSRPFENIGLDYFEPIYYNGRIADKKIWVMICTCLVTRNIHLEVVPDNTTYQFVLAMRRFFARRGTPKRVVLDNARTFKLGERIFNGDIKQMCENDEFFTAFLDSQPMEWNFITPLSPWKGGIYERLIAIVKKLLYASGDTAKLNFVEILTTITEIEGITNSRPIMPNSENFENMTAIRPADFIIPEVTLGIAQSAEEPSEVLNVHLEKIWDLWKDMYLLNLRESKGKTRAYSKTSPRTGQIVIVQEDKFPRHKWPLARITELHKSEDGQIRWATILCKKKQIKRSINHLVLLEIEYEVDEPRSTEAQPHPEKEEETNETPTTTSETKTTWTAQSTTNQAISRPHSERDITYHVSTVSS
uniref:Integrase catalytic domain-containing protein n=1 Tax=Caenorhabditis japonica TaxID=281687 RepID=A0A8R1E904_CAEJA